MLTYKEMKKKLKHNPERLSLKHFTEDFYNDFCKARETMAEQDWNRIYTSPFYRTDSFTYCVFLKEFTAALPIWEIQLFKRGRLESFVLEKRFVHAMTKSEVKRVGESLLTSRDADYAIITKLGGIIDV